MILPNVLPAFPASSSKMLICFHWQSIFFYVTMLILAWFAGIILTLFTFSVLYVSKMGSVLHCIILQFILSGTWVSINVTVAKIFHLKPQVVALEEKKEIISTKDASSWDCKCLHKLLSDAILKFSRFFSLSLSGESRDRPELPSIKPSH